MTGSGEAEVEFLVGFARVAHGAGYPSADLEERLVRLAAALGLDGAEVSATPTLVELSLGAVPQQRTFAVRVRPSSVDLDAVGNLDDLVGDVLDRRIGVPEALDRLERIRDRPTERPWPVVVAAYGVAGAALTPVLGGGWREAVGAGVVGLLVGALVLPLLRRENAEPMLAPLAAAAAGFSAAAVPELGLSASPEVVTLAALVSFLPGMTLTIGMRELATNHLQSGVANTANALVQLLGLVFGVGVGRSIAQSWFGPAPQVFPDTGFTGAHLVSAVAAGLAFTLTLRAKARSAPVMVAATVLAVTVYAAAKGLFGSQAAVFFAALAIGVTGGLLGRRLRRSPLVFIVPGVLMLVPGSAGFNSALQLLANETVSGITAAFDVFVAAMSIAYGLMVATVLLPRDDPPPSRGG